jgi:prolyl 3-hydroxylase /prolyl 3,4-dihydroxylase
MEIKIAGKNKDLKRNGTCGEAVGWIVSDSLSGPSKKMVKLSKWIESDLSTSDNEKTHSSSVALNQVLSQRNFIQNFGQSFSRNTSLKSTNCKLTNDPFLVTVVDDFLAEKSMIPNLVTEMESLDWTRKQMDLYEFYQTTDLANIQSQHLAQFFNFLNTDVKNWMQQLTGMKFQKISASCSMYNCGDFLLTHDDLLSDRLIAFVFYLSPWEGKESWTEAMGGALELFSTDAEGQPKFPVKNKILPANNQFVFFKVEKKSYHQVGEVLTKDYPRLTINGWFHGFEDNVDFDADAVKVKTPNVPIFRSPVNSSPKFNQFINKTYLKDGIKVSIQKQIEENSEAALGDFLINEFHKTVLEELQDPKLKWTTKGPSNQQNYDCLNTESLRNAENVKTLLDMMSSSVMFKLLHEYTELDVHGPNAKKPKFTAEIQRWKGGCYTLIGDPSTYNNDTLDLILYFGCNDNVGTITYLTPEEEHADSQSIASSEVEDEPVLLTVYPQNNFLNIVYRSQGTAKFTKYCSKSSFMESEFNYILFCSYKE